MLLISDLNLSNDDLATLTSIYNVNTFKSNNYEIMWVPIMEAHDEAIEKQFLDMRSRMQWYSCNSMVSKTAAKFIRDKWQFSQQTKVVVLNEQGKVVNTDAISMISRWGWDAFPFTEVRGKELGKSPEINWFKLVVNKTIYPFIEQCFERSDLLLS
ncbi:protein SIEVE ELEMENT OCCLUSION B [Eucalyptus grandis]|uniref:protein SIEVE ELEMENT OCCLUSION B n=1 Tax=Eucalyptus grandis TaxID=71139 RepID=UPI00192E92BC|nr:protein SIEVE ELEMENT OCCLUSION B [Eucalyptus grandis]